LDLAPSVRAPRCIAQAMSPIDFARPKAAAIFFRQSCDLASPGFRVVRPRWRNGGAEMTDAPWGFEGRAWRGAARLSLRLRLVSAHARHRGRDNPDILEQILR